MRQQLPGFLQILFVNEHLSRPRHREAPAVRADGRRGVRLSVIAQDPVRPQPAAEHLRLHLVANHGQTNRRHPRTLSLRRHSGTLAQITVLDTAGLARDHPVSAAEAQWFLEARKRGDVQALIEAFRHPELRPLAVRTLGELRATEAIPKLVPLLDARSNVLRRAVARALGRLQAREAHGRLLEVARSDGDPVVRQWAVFALGCIGFDRPDQRIIHLAADADAGVRHSAIGSLLASSATSAAGLPLRAREDRKGRHAIDRVARSIERERARSRAIEGHS